MATSTDDFGKVKGALFAITPGKILGLLQKYRISISICRINSKGPKGILARAGKEWIVIVQDTEESDRLISFAHELVHLHLFSEGLDDPLIKQDYPDELVEQASALFSLRYPDFLRNLWDLLKKPEAVVSSGVPNPSSQ